MRNKKGYSLLELLIVMLILAIIMAGLAVSIFDNVNKARGTVMIAEARLVHHTAAAALLEFKAGDSSISDNMYMRGFSGIIDDASKPIETKISKRMAQLLSPDVILADKPTTDMVRVDFLVENAEIKSMIYQKIVSKRLITILIKDGNATITQEKIK